MSFILPPSLHHIPEDHHNSSKNSFDDLTPLNLDQLHFNSIYQKSKIGYSSKHLSDSVVVATVIMEDVKRMAIDLMAENHINTKLPSHTLDFCFEIIESLVVVEQNQFAITKEETKKAQLYTTDEEPEPIKMDTWTRTKLVSRKPEEKPNAPNFIELQKQILGTELQKFTVQKVNEKANNYLNDLKEKNPPLPIDLDEAIRSTEDEDELRAKKENELRKINEKLEKERQKDNEIKNQQIELAKLQKEQKAKNFTYDYDGKVILVHGVKTEKFPPATYTCNVAFSQDWPPPLTDDQKKRLMKKKARESVMKPKFKKTPEEEKEFVKNIAMPSQPFSFDNFALTPGVSLTVNGKVKSELRPVTVTMANLTDPGIRMSKSDYYNLTRTGNLSREGLAKTDTKTFPLPPKQLGKINEESTSYHSEHPLPSLQKSLKKVPPPPPPPPSSALKIANPLLVQTLTGGREEEGEEDLFPPPVPAPLVRGRKEDAITSPIDKFNLDIISSKDWGRTMGTTASFKKGTVLTKSTKENKGAVNKLRDRGGKVKSKGNFLPAPMIGKVAGHGFYGTMGEGFRLPEVASFLSMLSPLLKFNFLLLGISTLISFNAVLGALDYFISVFPEDDVAFLTLIPNSSASLIFSLLIAKISARIGRKQRVYASILFSIALLIGFIVACENLKGKKTGFAIYMVLNFFVSAIVAIMQSTFLVLVFTFPYEATSFLNAGMGLSGIIMSLLRIISLATINSPLISMIIYFSCATFLLLITLFCYLKCEEDGIFKPEGVKEPLKPDNEFLTNPNDDPEEREEWLVPFLLPLLCLQTFSIFPGVIISKTYFGMDAGWSAVITILVFNIFDTFGKFFSSLKIGYTKKMIIVGVLLRFVLFIILILRIYFENFLENDFLGIFGVVLFAFSNGYYISFIFGKSVEDLNSNKKKENKGFIMSYLFNFGCVSGSLTALIFAFQ